MASVTIVSRFFLCSQRDDDEHSNRAHFEQTSQRHRRQRFRVSKSRFDVFQDRRAKYRHRIQRSLIARRKRQNINTHSAGLHVNSFGNIFPPAVLNATNNRVERSFQSMDNPKFAPSMPQNVPRYSDNTTYVKHHQSSSSSIATFRLSNRILNDPPLIPPR